MEHERNADLFYRRDFRNEFLAKLNNNKSRPKHSSDCLSDMTGQLLNEQAMKAKPKVHELGPNLKSKLQRHQALSTTSGGDADHFLHEHFYNPHRSSESYRQRNIGDNYSLNQNHCNPKTPTPAMPTDANSCRRKYYTTPDAVDECHRLYKTDSNLGEIYNDSEGSANSIKSSKTVVSRKSCAYDLQKLITSQCKLQQDIDEAIKKISNTELDANINDNACGLNEQLPTQSPLTLKKCKRCSDRVYPKQSQKNVTTEIGKSDFLECRNTDTLTITVDDVVNSKVINPMMRKLQRMYLNNLKEEMSLMEDLERLPHQVNEVYKATIFK